MWWSSTTLQWKLFHIKISHFIFAENQNEFMPINSKKNARTVDIGFKQSCWEGRSLLNRANVCWHWSTFWKSQLSSSQHFLLHQSWKMLFLMVILKFLTVGWLLGDSLVTAWWQLDDSLTSTGFHAWYRLMSHQRWQPSNSLHWFGKSKLDSCLVSSCHSFLVA